MTVAELIRLLEDCDGDSEVRFASQPSWPFEYSIADVVEHYPQPEPYPDEDDLAGEEYEGEPVVYLVEGQQLAYLPGAVKNELGW